jgi:hypothetical protein
MGFNSGNPLSYLGLPETDVPQITLSKRSPNSGDLNHKPGDMWINTISHSVYILSANQGGQAFWINVGAGGNGDLYITPYVVSATDAPYSTIQSAVNAAAGAGGGTVAIRAGTYVENVVLAPNVNLVGFSGLTLFPDTLIRGSITVGFAGSCSVTNIAITENVGPPIIVNGPGFVFLSLITCAVDSTSSEILNISPTTGQIITENCVFIQNGSFPHFVVTSGQLFNQNSIYADNNNLSTISIVSGNSRVQVYGAVANLGMQLSGNAQAEMRNCIVNPAVSPIFDVSGNARFTLQYCSCGLRPGVVAGNIIAPANVSVDFSSFSTTTAFAFTGTGNLSYDMMSFSGTSSFDPALTASPRVLRPLSTSGTTLNSTRGVCSFDNTSFSVDPSGFVTFNGGTIISTINAQSPIAGDFEIRGTANEITVTPALGQVALSFPDPMFAPGTLQASKMDVPTGVNASIGLSGNLAGGSVVVNTSAVTASSLIFVTASTAGGTQGILSVPPASIVPGVSFTILSDNALDTSDVNYWIIN